jgi:hypothetical protein
MVAVPDVRERRQSQQTLPGHPVALAYIIRVQMNMMT